MHALVQEGELHEAISNCLHWILRTVPLCHFQREEHAVAMASCLWSCHDFQDPVKVERRGSCRSELDLHLQVAWRCFTCTTVAVLVVTQLNPE